MLRSEIHQNVQEMNTCNKTKTIAVWNMEANLLRIIVNCNNHAKIALILKKKKTEKMILFKSSCDPY